jgi:hypothetical protein
MIKKLIDNHQILNDLYYNNLNKTREIFDFNNPSPTFQKMENDCLKLKVELEKHFNKQEQLKNQINSKVDKIVMENMLVKSILLRMCDKIIDGAKRQDVNIFNFFDDFEEIFKAYLKKEDGVVLQDLDEVTGIKEKQKIKELLS